MMCLLWLLANLDVQTTVPKIDWRSPATRAGVMFFSLNGDDFQTASPEDPIYIRIRMDKGTRYAQTLVDLEGAESMGEPINLALFIEGKPGAKLMAPEDSVQVVRWRKGEGEIWLMVPYPSSTWLEVDGQREGPQINWRVSYVLGRASELDRSLIAESYALGRANLPHNGDVLSGVHTFLMLDTSSSILEADSPNGQQSFDHILFQGSRGVRTAADPKDIFVGDQISANFSSDLIIGRATVKQPVDWVPLPHQCDGLELSVFNSWPESRPIAIRVLEGDGASSDRWLVAPPGLSTQTLGDGLSEANGSSIVVVEAELMDVSVSIENESGHRFHLPSPVEGTHVRFPILALEGTESWLLAVNPNDRPVSVNLFRTDHWNNEWHIETRVLKPLSSDSIPLNASFGREGGEYLVVRSDQPVSVRAVQQTAGDQGTGWMRPLPVLVLEP